jgi:hypothetical protein
VLPCSCGLIGIVQEQRFTRVRVDGRIILMDIKLLGCESVGLVSSRTE